MSAKYVLLSAHLLTNSQEAEARQDNAWTSPTNRLPAAHCSTKN